MKNQNEIFAYEALRAFALTHNYNRWIYEIFRRYLGRRILEVGCGIGNLTRYFFEPRGGERSVVMGVDTSSSFLGHLKIDYPELEACECDIVDEKVLALADKNIDTIVCVNVLEHIKDEDKALSNMRRLLAPGGHLLLFIPALPFLYGTLDKHAEHYRRYMRNPLKKKLETAGFKVEEIYYSNFPGIFGWFVNGRILRRKSFPILQPIFFDKIVPLLFKLEKFVKPPIGLSLVAVAKREK